MGGTIMWLFITAVFLVVVWLLYRWPKQTRQGFVKGLVIVLGLIAVFGVLIWLSSVEDEKRWQAEQAELAKVVITASYDAANCTGEKPLHVFIENRSSKTVNAIRWGLEAYVPRHSTNVVDILTDDYKSDAILKPNQFASYCYPPPKLNFNVDPTLLEYKIARPDIPFEGD
jgi:hypothetical protein